MTVHASLKEETGSGSLKLARSANDNQPIPSQLLTTEICINALFRATRSRQSMPRQLFVFPFRNLLDTLDVAKDGRVLLRTGVFQDSPPLKMIFNWSRWSNEPLQRRIFVD
jgi:hypothetical protein